MNSFAVLCSSCIGAWKVSLIWVVFSTCIQILWRLVLSRLCSKYKLFHLKIYLNISLAKKDICIHIRILITHNHDQPVYPCVLTYIHAYINSLHIQKYWQWENIPDKLYKYTKTHINKYVHAYFKTVNWCHFYWILLKDKCR